MLASNLRRSRRALGPATFCVLTLCAASTAVWADASHLEVLDDHGQALVSLPMPEGERWCMEWNHSVTGIRVQDCYRHHQGNMVLERSHQPDFAAGLGHVPGRGRQVSDGQGGYWIEDIDEPVPGNRYRLRVGSARVDHRLLHEGRRISLSELAAGERVTIHLRTPDSTP